MQSSINVSNPNINNTTNINNMNRNITHSIYKRNTYYCGNCGKHGHVYKHCKEPIISIGIILVKIKKSSDDDKIVDELISKFNSGSHNIFDGSSGIKYNNSSTMLSLFCEYINNIEFLMIRRKHSLGYIEFIRGRYSVENIEGIIYLFTQMMKEEINRVKTWDFDDLWKELWSNNNPPYHNEYIKSKKKFGKLREGVDTELNLDYYVENVKPVWDYAEWGFPKGRRNNRELDLECANREFREESGYRIGEYKICNNIEPIIENLMGTNGRKYRHIYYVAINKIQKKLSINPQNSHQSNEIGDIGWFTHDKVIKFLRPFHKDKRKIITHLYMYIINNIISVKLEEASSVDS